MPLSRRAVEKMNTAMREAKSEGYKMVITAFNDFSGEITFMSSASNDPDTVAMLAHEALTCLTGTQIKIAEA